MSGLKTEIAQKRPFASVQEEAILNLMRTADCVERAFQQAIRPWGITSTQYNALRILRGAHPEGLTCSAIGERMVTAVPDITRLLARLKARHLIRQHRDRRDRRILWTDISEAGLALLKEMDALIARMPRELLGHLEEGEVGELIRLLEVARVKCQGEAAGPTCDGTPACEGDTDHA
ncbi:MAG TPA: MarR family winged helix-turn-helix transcriptional regulator [Terracidiphilus sp.]|nr:MarR family winged helix-turn-helix transcriptional regulator [Terracidiphilus sp.]